MAAGTNNSGGTIDNTPDNTPPPDSVDSSTIIDNTVASVDILDGSITPTDLDRAYVEKNGDTMLGDLDIDTNSLYFADVEITRVAANVVQLATGDFLRTQETPVDPLDVVNKSYVDSVASGSFLPLAGGTMSGAIDMDGFNIDDAGELTSRDRVRGLRMYAYKDATFGVVVGALEAAGGVGRLQLGDGTASPDWALTHSASNVARLGVNDFIRSQVDPVDNEDLTRKGWVDTQLAGKAAAAHTHVEADITDLGDYVDRTGDTMAGNLNFAGNQLNDAGKVDIYGTGQVFEVYDSNTDTHPRLAVRGADGALQMGPGGGTAPAIQFQYQSPGQVTFTGIGSGSGTGQFLASTQLISEKLILDPTPTHGAAGTGSVEIDGNTSTPSISLGGGAAAPDWVLTRTAANIAALSAGDKLQQNEAPEVGDDLTNKTYVDSQTLFGDEYQIESQTTPLATTSGTYAQFMRLTTPSLPAGTYRIGWRFKFMNSTMATVGQFKLELDDTTVEEERLLESAAGGTPQRYANFTTAVLGAGVHTLDIDGRVDSGAGTFTLDLGKIEIWRIS